MPTILIVDDEMSIRQVLRAFFERAGMESVLAASAQEALRTVENGQQVDAVVTDVLMPEVSGVSFYDVLMAREPRLAGRVVFLTGAARDPGVHTPVEQRGVPLLSKLDDLRLVVDAVRVAIIRARSAPLPSGSSPATPLA